MRTKFWAIWKDDIMRFLLRVNLIIVALMLMMIGWRWRNLPPQAPLFYSRPWGEAQLAPEFFLFILPAVAGLFLFINFSLAAMVWRHSLFLARLLAGSTFLILLILSFACVRILLLV